MNEDDLILEFDDDDTDLYFEFDTGDDVELNDALPYYEQVFDYRKLDYKPSINGVTLNGEKSLPDLGIEPISNEVLDQIFSWL